MVLVGTCDNEFKTLNVMCKYKVHYVRFVNESLPRVPTQQQRPVGMLLSRQPSPKSGAIAGVWRTRPEKCLRQHAACRTTVRVLCSGRVTGAVKVRLSCHSSTWGLRPCFRETRWNNRRVSFECREHCCVSTPEATAQQGTMLSE